MVVTCSQCSTKFKIADDKITATGVKVRCSKCKHMFVVKPDGVHDADEKPASPPPAAAVPPPPPAPASAAAPAPVSDEVSLGDLPTGKVAPPPIGGATPGDLSLEDMPTGKVAPPPLGGAASGEVSSDDIPTGKFPLPPPPSLPTDDDDGIPDDIFSTPTKVGPPPAEMGAQPLPPPPPATTFVGPAPPKPATQGGAVPPPPVGAAPPPPDSVPAPVDKVDLDSDLVVDADSLPPSASGSIPPPPSKASGSGGTDIGEDLFADLDKAVDAKLGPEPGAEAPAAAPAGPAVAPPPIPEPVPPPAAPPPPPAQGTSGPKGDPSDPFADLNAVAPPVPAPPGGAGPDDDPFASMDVAAPSGSASGVLDDPFGTLPAVDEAAAQPTSGPEADPAEPAPPAASADDPFSGIDLSPPESKATSANDDPFAGIDLDAPPAAPASDPSSGPPPASASAGDELFGDMGDPFAGTAAAAGGAAPPPAPADAAGAETVMEKPPAAAAASDPFGGDLFGPEEMGGAAAAPGPPPSADAALDGDPFASLGGDAPGGGVDSAGGGAPAVPGMDPGVGHDPFAALDSGGPSLELGGDDEPSGLEMDASGNLTGEAMPAPPPTKTAGGGVGSADSAPPPDIVSRPPGPPPMAIKPTEGFEPQKGASLPVKIGFGLILVLMALFVFVVFRSGGKPDLFEWSTYQEAFTGGSGDVALTGDLRAVDIASTAYANRDGHRIVVLWGKVQNTATEGKANVVVAGQLLGAKDAVIEEFTAPAGISFSSKDVFAMTDVHAVGDAYRASYAEKPTEALAAGETLPFMVVMFDHPERMDDVRIRVLPKQSDDPLSGLPAPAPTAARDDGEGMADEGEVADDEDGGSDPPPRATPGAAKAKVTGKVVKKSGTFVKMGPTGKKPKPTPVPAGEGP